MCGIYGFVGHQAQSNLAVLHRMGDALAHRGPDDGGQLIETSETNCTALGHKRLSIIDLSAAGKQPIPNESKSIWLTLNGEIYNYLALRQELEAKGHRFRSQSDSEVVVHLYEEHAAGCLDRLNGMFAFALWDREKQTLLLARDRIGKKPLHYCITQDELIFASEIKSLLQHPAVSRELDLKGLSKYLSYEYIPAPQTIFRSIKKLEPGHYLTYANGQSRIARYWDLPLDDGERTDRNEQDCVEELKTLLDRSVRSRLVADVPVGLFVSGGLDSGMVAAFAAKAQSPLDCFSIGFDETSFDESIYSKQIAASLGIRYHLNVFTAREMLGLVERLPRLIDEPLADPSIFPLYLLSRFASEQLKVVLSGDGGDELFAGYQTFQAHKLMRYYSALPGFVRTSIRKISQCLPVSHEYLSTDYKIKQFLKADGVSPEIGFFLWRGAFSRTDQQKLLAPEIRAELGASDCYEDIDRYVAQSGLGGEFERLLYLCMKLYLQDNNLVTVDRASMANGLEVRCPLLDQDLVEFVCRLSANYKLKGFQPKYLLKKAAAGLLPQTIIRRQKKGFGIPLAKWLSTDLKEFMLDHLNEHTIKRQGIFDYSYVKRLIDEQLGRIKDHREPLWTLLVFQSWYEEYIENSQRAEANVCH